MKFDEFKKKLMKLTLDLTEIREADTHRQVVDGVVAMATDQ